MNASPKPVIREHDFDAWTAELNLRASDLLADKTNAFYHAPVEANLFDEYLKAFPFARRQHHNCRACGDFINRYGDVVVLRADGSIEPLYWTLDQPSMPDEMRRPVQRLHRLLMESAPKLALIRGGLPARPLEEQLSSGMMGIRQSIDKRGTPGWTHLFMTVPSACRRVLTDHDVECSLRVLLRFSEEKHLAGVLDRAIAGFESGAIAGKERFLDTLLFIEKHAVEGDVTPISLLNAAYRSFQGVAHFNGGILGALIDNLASGSDAGAFKAFRDQYAPTAYQRPTAPPKAGTLDRAEKLFDEMGLAPALRRMSPSYTNPAIERLWSPTPVKEPAGTFDHLRQHTARGAAGYAQLGNMTAAKFMKDWIGTGKVLELNMRITNNHVYWLFYTAPVLADAPKIIRWPNQISWYMYTSGTDPSQANVPTGDVPVHAITRLPCHFEGQGDGGSAFPQSLIFVPAVSGDLRKHGGIGLFPVFLTPELHEVRSVIEAHSNGAMLETIEPGSAGLRLNADTLELHPVTLTFTATTGKYQATLDRFE